MILKSNDNGTLGIICNCGCDNGVLIRADKDEYGYQISLVSDTYYTSQNTPWGIFKEKCKRILKILCNEEHYYFDICLSEEDIEEIRNYIANVWKERISDCKMCSDEDMAIDILEFIKRNYENHVDQAGCQKYIEALQMGIAAINNKE